MNDYQILISAIYVYKIGIFLKGSFPLYAAVRGRLMCIYDNEYYYASKFVYDAVNICNISDLNVYEMLHINEDKHCIF